MNFKQEEIQQYLDDQIKEIKEYDIERYNQLVEDGDLHNEIFNTDYYLTYTYEAEEWLGSKVFDIIRYVKEYENDTFGEEYTDVSDPVKLVNMYVYIIGEELIGELLNWFSHTFLHKKRQVIQ